ncbi:MAG TPA: 2-hydroxyacyl-CoA dehydratase family protein [Bacillota bacterium]|jgi:benzoyl-CoA reductase/2-hydroxyglutaryl-CoA dehydratase subunit BcrC/BadD/HgdB|nr:2-hydroxyacyl-CoA dehydratase family protein [Bacillota bacterium]HQE10935.1 2-hydroxyacyl-CoA dehydratase family protein [Bacillota bacterium]
MNNIIETFGRIVSVYVPKRPQVARRLLTAAYTLNGGLNTFFPVKGLSKVYARMNAAVSRMICHAFRQPERTVMVNIFFPCEILYAMDLTPMFPEGLSVYVANTACERVFAEKAENNYLPETFCSYHKIMIGLAETGVLPRPLLIANTTLACDANQLSFRRLAKFYQVPHVVVDVPYRADEEAVRYVAGQLKSLTALLEEQCQRRLNEDRLRAIVARSRRTLENYRGYLELRADSSLPTTMSGELFALLATHVLLGAPAGEKFMAELRENAGKAGRTGRNPGKKRILWLHTLPNWQASLKVIFDEANECEIVGCDMAYDTLVELDPEKPYESMARRVVYNLNNGGGERRVNAAVKYAKALKADGVLIFCHWGCKQTQGLSQFAKEVLEKEGFPTLILDGDGCDTRNVSDGQMVTRVKAFLEQLEGVK